MTIDEKTIRQLMLLRVQLYGAMQTLKGQALREFWELIEEINDSRELFTAEEREETEPRG